MESTNSFDTRQAGFRNGYRTTDNIFVLRTLIQKYKKSKKKLYACFVDFSKAFDSIWRDGLLYKLQHYQITGKIFKLIAHMYSDVQYVIKTQNKVTEPVTSSVGVKQGCVCSPTLLNIYINDMQDNLQTDSSDAPRLEDTALTHLLFADDLILLSHSAKGLQHNINNLNRFKKTKSKLSKD